MGYLLNHTALYDGEFNLLHLIIILISVAVITYCSLRLSALNKKKKELEKAAAAKETAEAATTGE